MSDAPNPLVPPQDFTGMLYAPDAEVAVYLLMGLLWKYLPYQLAFEAFELNPNREGYGHTKFLDAKGKILESGTWHDVSIEFKLYSSGLLRDLKKHPGLTVDLLVCWIHDDPTVESAAARILELRSVYRGLPPEVQAAIVLNPEQSLPRLQKTGSLTELLARFSAENRPKVQSLIAHWPEVAAGSAEVKFLRGAITVFRACKYSSEHLIVSVSPPGVTFSEVVSKVGGEELQTTVRIQLDNLDSERVAQLVELLRG